MSGHPIRQSDNLSQMTTSGEFGDEFVNVNIFPRQCVCALCSSVIQGINSCLATTKYEKVGTLSAFLGICCLQMTRRSHTNQRSLLSLYWSKRYSFIGKGIPIINLRRSSDHLRFIMGIPIPQEDVFFVNRGPGVYMIITGAMAF